MDRRWCVHTLVRSIVRPDFQTSWRWTDSNGQTVVCPHTGQIYRQARLSDILRMNWFKWTDGGVSTHWSDLSSGQTFRHSDGWTGSNEQTIVCPHTGQIYRQARLSDILTMNWFKWTDGGVSTHWSDLSSGQTFRHSADELIQMDRRWCVHTLVRSIVRPDFQTSWRWTDSNGQTVVCPHTGQIYRQARLSDILTMNWFKWTDGGVSTHWSDLSSGQTFRHPDDELIQMDRRWCVHTLVRSIVRPDFQTSWRWTDSNGQTIVCPHTGQIYRQARLSDILTMNWFKWTDGGVSTHWSDLSSGQTFRHPDDELIQMDRRWCVHTLVRSIVRPDFQTSWRWTDSNGQTVVCPHTGQIYRQARLSDILTMNWFKWTDDGVSTHWSDLSSGQTFRHSADELIQMDRRWCVHTLVRSIVRPDFQTSWRWTDSNGQTVVCPHTGQIYRQARLSDILTMNWFKWTDGGVSTHWSDLSSGQTFRHPDDELIQMDRRWCVHTLVRSIVRPDFQTSWRWTDSNGQTMVCPHTGQIYRQARLSDILTMNWFKWTDGGVSTHWSDLSSGQTFRHPDDELIQMDRRWCVHTLVRSIVRPDFQTSWRWTDSNGQTMVCPHTGQIYRQARLSDILTMNWFKWTDGGVSTHWSDLSSGQTFRHPDDELIQMDRRWCVHTLVRSIVRPDFQTSWRWTDSNGQTVVCPHTGQIYRQARLSDILTMNWFKWTDGGVSTHWSGQTFRSNWFKWTDVRPDFQTSWRWTDSNGQTVVCPHTGQIYRQARLSDILTMNWFKWTDGGVSTHWSDLSSGQTFRHPDDELIQMDRRWCVHTLVRSIVRPDFQTSWRWNWFKWTDGGVSTHWSDLSSGQTFRHPDDELIQMDRRWCVHTLVRSIVRPDFQTSWRWTDSNGQTVVCPHTGQIYRQARLSDILTMNWFKWTDGGVSTHWSDLSSGQTFRHPDDELIQMDRR